MENRNGKEHAQSCKADLCLMAKSNSQAHSFPMHSALHYVCYASICFSLSYPEMHKNRWYVDCYAVYLHVVSKLPLFSILCLQAVAQRALVMQAEEILKALLANVYPSQMLQSMVS